MDNKQKEYFRLGVFTLIGIFFLIGVLIFFSKDSFFQKTVIVETYMDEPINGLEVGSALRLLGVQIGSVSEIGFLQAIYPDKRISDRNYVVIRCKVNLSTLAGNNIPVKTVKSELLESVKNGLRIRVESVGLTGQSILSANFIQNSKNSFVPTWEIEEDIVYIPSAPTILGQVESAVARVSDVITSINTETIDAMLKNASTIIENLATVTGGKDAREFFSATTALFNETANLVAIINEGVDPNQINIMVNNFSEISTSAKRITLASEKDISEIIGNTDKLLSSMNNLMKNLDVSALNKSLAELPETFRILNSAGSDVGMTIAKLHVAINKMLLLFTTESENVSLIIRNTENITENLRNLTNYLQNNPGALLRGTPPEESQID